MPVKNWEGEDYDPCPTGVAETFHVRESRPEFSFGAVDSDGYGSLLFHSRGRGFDSRQRHNADSGLASVVGRGGKRGGEPDSASEQDDPLVRGTPIERRTRGTGSIEASVAEPA